MQPHSIWAGLAKKKRQEKENKKGSTYTHQKVSIIPFSPKLEIEEIFCGRL